VAGLGYESDGHHESWGKREVYTPSGVVIPYWTDDGTLWHVNVRRIDGGLPKYLPPAGGSNAMYGGDCVGDKLPVVLVEGELDALTVRQVAGDITTTVATGSTCKGRDDSWFLPMCTAPVVLVAFDADVAGEKASRFWIDNLPGIAFRWKPTEHDINDMLTNGIDVRSWVIQGSGDSSVKLR
jgi:hypothetical protein